jgi:3-phosphoshikimate 1-carboxyvinyltransferase
MLASLGAPVTSDALTVTLSPVDSIAALDVVVPGDPSSAAYLVALGILRGDGEVTLPEVNLNPTRIGFLEALKAMGADIECTSRLAMAGDSVATVIARPSSLHSIEVGASLIPRMIDELPLLACVAAAAGIDLEVTGAAELRVKESDRIASVVENLRSVGANAEELPDGFRVIGGAQRLAGFVKTRGDHRIAMSFGVLAQLPGNAIEMDDPDCVSVSYPRFWADLEGLKS